MEVETVVDMAVDTVEAEVVTIMDTVLVEEVDPHMVNRHNQLLRPSVLPSIL